MQSKILDFEIEGKGNAYLYGDFNSLNPLVLHGIAHAFKQGSSAILTLYSETGVEAEGSLLCSADMRLSVDSTSLSFLIKQLTDVRTNLFAGEESSGTEQTVSENQTDPTKEEKLGPPL